MEFEKEIKDALNTAFSIGIELGRLHVQNPEYISNDQIAAIKQAVDTHVIGEDDKDKSDKAWIDFPVRIRNDVRKIQRKALWGKGEHNDVHRS